MSTFTKQVLGILAGVCVCWSALATMLAYDGVPLGTGAYAAGGDLRNKSTSVPAIFGFGGAWSNTTTTVARSWGTGLLFPESFADVAVTGGAFGLNNGGTGPSSEGRLQYRLLETNLVADGAAVLYFRALIRNAAGGHAPMKEGCYQGVGVFQNKPSSVNKGGDGADANSCGYNLTTDGLWFAFKRDASAAGFSVVLHLKGNPDYMLVESAASDVTYLCVAEVKIGAGTDGAELVRAFAMPVEEYVDGTPYSLDVGVDGVAEAELVGDAATLNFLGFGGAYMTNSKDVLFDEIALATALYDVLPLADGAPVIGSAELSRDANGDYTVSAMLANGSGDVKAVARTKQGAEVVNVLGTAVEAEVPLSTVLSELMEDTTYSVFVCTESAGALNEVWIGTFYTGVLGLTLVNDASEMGFVPGRVEVSRADAGFSLPVTFALHDVTAVAGTDYVPPASYTVLLPNDSETAVVEITPLNNADVQSDTTFEVELVPGYYDVDGVPVPVTITNALIPTGVNAWLASVAGNASVAANWSLGRVPQAGDRIFLNELSTADMTWDAGVNGLTDTVAEWTQDATYTGTVTFMTTYAAASTVFTNLTVTGDVTINNGVWTHAANNDTQTYRLSVSVGGDLTLTAAAKIDLQYKGYAIKKFPAGGAEGVYGGSRDNFAQVYGNVYAPEDIGTGGPSRAGGGALWLNVAGRCLLNGPVNASNFESTSMWNSVFGGSGGSIYVRAASIAGAGIISANGTITQANGSSGGRIALITVVVDELELPLTNVYARGDAGISYKGAGGGTVFIKTASQPNGTLLVDSSCSSYMGWQTFLPSVYGTTCVKPGETWTFDSIITRNFGVLSVPPNATLVLPNGFASVTSTDATLNDGILYMGGTIVVPETGTHTFRSNWVFQATEPFTLNGDVNVVEQGALGCVPRRNTLTEFAKSDLHVAGNLFVDTSSRITAVAGGSDWDGTYARCCVHGGQSGWYATSGVSRVYGSVFNPQRPGIVGSDLGKYNAVAIPPWQEARQDTRYPGGGVLILKVDGTMTLNGKLTASVTDITYEIFAGGAGSINLTLGALLGTGSIEASSYYPVTHASNAGKVMGAPGRIAIRLTQPGAGFDAFGLTNIHAKAVGARSNPDRMNSAGTVYLQTASDAEGAGRILIRNNDDANNTMAYTPLPSEVLDGESDVFTAATLEIGNAGRVQLQAPLKMQSLTIETGSALNLRGQQLIVKTAKIDGVKLWPGVYTPDNLPGGLLEDSIGGGELLIRGLPVGITVF